MTIGKSGFTGMVFYPDSAYQNLLTAPLGGSVWFKRR